MRAERIKVLYIAGLGHSGSSILTSVLGQPEGFFAVGEFINIWRVLKRPRLRCGCGVRVRDCEVWQAVFQEVYGGFDQVDPQAYFPYLDDLRGKALSKPRDPGVIRYRETTSALYETIRNVTHSRVIVDSSKSVAYARFLESLPFVDLHVVHLVRDSRGVVFSNLRWEKKRRERQDLDPDLGLRSTLAISASTSRAWWKVNVGAGYTWRGTAHKTAYLRLRYEDFVAEPQATVQKIVTFVGEEIDDLPFASSHEIQLEPTHTVSGNLVRLQHGLTALRLDTRWREQMGILGKVSTTLLTLPLLLRYRYALW